MELRLRFLSVDEQPIEISKLPSIPTPKYGTNEKLDTLKRREGGSRFPLKISTSLFTIFIVPSEEAFEAVKLTNRDMALLVSSGVNNIVP